MSRVLMPTDLDQVWEALAEEPGAALMAGGTDLLVDLARGGSRPPLLVCLEGVAALRGVSERDGGLSIGAAAGIAELLEDPLIAGRLPVLHQALAVHSAPAVRNAATIGGNICTASPAGDCLPPLYALGAGVVLASAAGERRLDLTEFITGPRRTALRPGEVLARVEIPAQPAWEQSLYAKVGRRRALAIAVVSLAALVRRDEGGRVAQARLAWGSLGPTVVTCPAAEAALQGGPLDQEALARAAAAITASARPIDDVRASAAYRRRVAGNLLYRLMED